MSIIPELVERARKAQKEFETFATQELVDKIATEIAKVIYDNAEPLAKMAVEESRMGRYEDKVKKNRGKAKIIANSLKGKISVGIISENKETGITEVARPMGVIAAITPCTNPIVTPMCNSMFAIKGRNAIIIAPHPRSKKCTAVLVDMFHKVLRDNGAPEDLILFVEEPSTDLSAELMSACDAVVATGGMPMVKAAYSSGRPAYGVGAGNVQCIIDRDVDFESTVPKIIEGRAFDNGIICSGEQTIIVHEDDYDKVIEIFKKNGAFYIDDPATVDKLRNTLFVNGAMNKFCVGQDALKIAEMAGIQVPESTKVIIVKPETCGKEDLFSEEKMCPVISAYKWKTWDEALAIAQANLDVKGRGHSASIHSNNRAHLEEAASKLTVCRVLVNQVCSTSNGGSFANGLTPTTTLGCGSWGNNSISENFSYKHLINVIRIACPIKDAKIPSDEEVF